MCRNLSRPALASLFSYKSSFFLMYWSGQLNCCHSIRKEVAEVGRGTYAAVVVLPAKHMLCNAATGRVATATDAKHTREVYMCFALS